jgi:hypothetical protein
MIRIKFKGYVLSLAAPPDLFIGVRAGRKDPPCPF